MFAKIIFEDAQQQICLCCCDAGIPRGLLHHSIQRHQEEYQYQQPIYTAMEWRLETGHTWGWRQEALELIQHH